MAEVPAPRRRRALRSDAVANREALLVTAARIVRDRGPAVPLAEVAAEAGVGIGTLYRHFPDRDALLTALAVRSRDVLLEQARRAVADAGAAAAETVAAFLGGVAARRAELLPPPADDSLIADALDPVVRRGVEQGGLRADATAADVVLAAVLLARAAPGEDARRHLAIFLDGLRAP